MNVTVHNDLSGQELIDGIPGINGGKPFYENCPRRLYIHLGGVGTHAKWCVIIGERTQGWSPWYGYRGFMGNHWWPIVVHPGLGNRCQQGCGRARGHKGPHR